MMKAKFIYAVGAFLFVPVIYIFVWHRDDPLLRILAMGFCIASALTVRRAVNFSRINK